MSGSTVPGQLRIVILDGHTANPGDLDWDALDRLGEVAVYARTAPDEVAERIRDADVVLTNKCVLNSDFISMAPRLKCIGVLATGTNVVDGEAARARRIPVMNVPAYSTDSVAQLVFAHILHWYSAVGPHGDSVANGDWSRQPDFSYWLHPLEELSGQTLGILGFGQIGQKVGQLGHAFGMEVMYTSQSEKNVGYPCIRVSREDLFRRADILTLHCPLTPETHHIINAGHLNLMKPKLLLVNTGRGDLIDEEALAQALAAGHLRGASLDVLSAEPPAPDHPLVGADRCLITPHLGWATVAARRRLIACMAANLKAWIQGAPVNVVNGV